MNIFVLDNDPRKAAEMLCDRHLVKMCVETARGRITSSPEVLAESSVYFEEEHTFVLEGSDCGVTFSGGWTSPFIEYTYGTKPEAIAATLAKLKEVCDE